MKGLNIWGICTFVMPLVLIIIIWLMLIIAFILARIANLIKNLGGNYERVKRKAS